MKKQAFEACLVLRPAPLSRASSVALAALSAVALTAATLAIGAQPPRGDLQKATLEAFADRTAYLPGESVRLAGRATIEHGWHVQSHQPTLEYLIPTVLQVATPPSWGEVEVDIEYPPDSMWRAGFADDQELAVYEGEPLFFAEMVVPEDAAEGSTPLTLTLDYQACDDRVCLPPTSTSASLRLVVGPGGAEANREVFADEDPASAGSSPLGAGGLALMLSIGIVGGLILNAMPCVLPVLSLKVFGMVKAAGMGRREVTLSALATAAGILVSFWALAATAIGIRAAGGLVGWGIQFQNPIFVAFLAVVLVFFCLNMWGLYEIRLPAAIAGALGSRGSGSGLFGHFGSGLFATLMATPCSAPFLGTAVGFALSQSSAVTLLMFSAVGVGMALPYLLLALAPGTASVLPRPGAWMEYLKGTMGFLLAGTAVWLLYVLSAQLSPPRLAVLEITILGIGFFAWLKRRLGSEGAGPRWAIAGMLLFAALTLVLAAGADPAGARGRGEIASRLDWVDFDESRAQDLAASGRLVFVDVTADWCATCKVNERLVLETEVIAELFDRHQVVAMRADWTNRDDRIATYLAEHGRYAIPFYVLYRPGAEPHTFGELLTKKEVISVVEDSAAVAVSAR